MKKVLALLLAAMLIFACACDATQSTTDQPTSTPEAGSTGTPDPETGDAVTYLNEYLGLALAVPNSWVIYDMDEDNLNTEPGNTAGMDKLNIDEGLMALISLGNTDDVQGDDNIEADFYAEDVTDFADMDEFLQLTQDYFEEDVEDTVSYRLQTTSDQSFNGTDYVFMRYLGIGDTEEERAYCDVYIAEVNGYYVSFQFIYWADNDAAGMDIYMFMNDCVKFE